MSFEYHVYKHLIGQTVNMDWYAEDCGLSDQLNLLGAKGWELVSSSPVETDGPTVKVLVCVLKRTTG